MQQSQARQVQKELQDALSQLDSIRYEVRSLSLMNPDPMTRKLMENPAPPPPDGDSSSIGNHREELKSPTSVIKDNVNLSTSESLNMHTQATTYAKLAESATVKTGSSKSNAEKDGLIDENGLFTILPISAESTRMRPKRKENVHGSDIVLEAVLEAELTRNAKDFFSQPENQIQ